MTDEALDPLDPDPPNFNPREAAKPARDPQGYTAPRARMQPQDAFDLVRGLMEHFPQPARSDPVLKAYVDDFVMVLAGKDAEAVRAAIKSWKLDPKSKKMPTPGQLLAKVLELAPARPRAASTGDRGPRRWTPASVSELEGMSWEDAEREHRLQAHRFRTMAGPMWTKDGSGAMIGNDRAGRPMKVDEMDPTRRERYLELSRKAQFHEDAAAGLRRQIQEAAANRANREH